MKTKLKQTKAKLKTKQNCRDMPTKLDKSRRLLFFAAIFLEKKNCPAHKNGSRFQAVHTPDFLAILGNLHSEFSRAFRHPAFRIFSRFQATYIPSFLALLGTLHSEFSRDFRQSTLRIFSCFFAYPSRLAPAPSRTAPLSCVLAWLASLAYL